MIAYSYARKRRPKGQNKDDNIHESTAKVDCDLE